MFLKRCNVRILKSYKLATSCSAYVSFGAFLGLCNCIPSRKSETKVSFQMAFGYGFSPNVNISQQSTAKLHTSDFVENWPKVSDSSAIHRQGNGS